MHEIEQQIYASLAHPDLKPGHHTHAHTEGLDRGALERYEGICNRWGVYEPGADFNRAIVQVPLWEDDAPPVPPSHYLVIMVTYQGRDAGGRQGAMLRHIVRVSAEDHERLQYNPFHLQRNVELLESWAPAKPLPEMVIPVDPTRPVDIRNIFPERYPLLRHMLGRLLDTGRLALPTHSDSPAIEESFGQLVELIPVSWRRWMSMATFCYRSSDDFSLVALREEDASFRRSLNELESDGAESTSEEVSAYLDELFDAMSKRDWDNAIRIIQESTLAPQEFVGSPMALGAEPPPVVEEESPATEAPTEGPRPPQDGPTVPRGPRPGGPPPPAPPLRREPVHKGGSSLRTRLLVGLVVVVAVAGAVGLLRRGGNNSEAPPAGERMREASAASLADLVDQHERLLGDLLAADSRDFDLSESMRSASQTLEKRARAAKATQLSNLDRELTTESEEEGGAFAALASVLRRVSQREEQEARAIEGLRQLLESADAQQLRQGYDQESGQLSLPVHEGAVWEGFTLPFMDRVAAHRRVADVFDALSSDAGSRDPAIWSAAAADASTAEAQYPQDYPAPTAVQVGIELISAMSDLLAAENAADLASLAVALPYRRAALSSGALGDASLRFVEVASSFATTGQGGAGAADPARVFYQIARNSDATLAELAAVCAEDAGVCDIDAYSRHVARLKLERWRRIGVEGGEGADAVEASGDAAYPESDANALAAMIDLADRMESAASPASPTLVEQVRSQRQNLGNGLYGGIADAWLGRQQRGAARQRGAFAELYDQMKTSLGRLRQADNASAPATHSELRQLCGSLDGIDLSQAEARSDQAPQVRAARSLASALDGKSDLVLGDLTLHLLRGQDYAGKVRPLARPIIQIRRVGGGDVLMDIEAPAMLTAPGTGFAETTLELNGSLEVAADDRLLIMAKERDGGVWFHLYIDAPRGGHIAESLSRSHEIQVTPELMSQVAANPDAMPGSGSGGEPVATLRFRLADGWWRDFARSLPQLP